MRGGADGLGGRAASEVVGVVLLTGVIVVLVTLVGGVLLSEIDSQRNEVPAISCDIGYRNGAVEIAHGGGESATESELAVILSNVSGGPSRVPFAVARGDGDDQFESGEVGTFGGLAETTTVRLVSNDRLVCDDRVDP